MNVFQTMYNYWFRYGSPVAFGVFRALLSGLILVNLFMIGVYFTDFFGDRGFLPASLGSRWLNPHVPSNSELHLNRIDPIYGVTNDAVVLAFYIVTSIAAFFSTLGLYTRASTIIMAIGLISIHHRDAALLHGGDTAMRVGAMYLAMGPAGAAFSLDRYFARKKGIAPSEPELVSMWPQRLCQYNMALIYFTTSWAKWFGTLWKSGNATWYPARLHEFDRFPVPTFINEFPMVKLTSWGTLLTEFALATMVWFKPIRKYVLLAGLAMHSFIEYSMNVPLFAFVMMSFYVCFYEGDEVAGWWDRLKARFTKKNS
jgi:hypothetical protein